MSLVTARHIVDGLKGHDLYMRLNSHDGASQITRVVKDTKWLFHDDPLVDVAVLAWMPPGDIVDYKWVGIDIAFSESLHQSIGPGDDVCTVGLFAHVSGAQRNIPIVRSGNIAMVPCEPVPTSSGEIEAYLIESRSIGGLSGSPAFVWESTVGQRRGFLLGVVKGHWDIPAENKNDLAADAQSSVNMGIAIVVPASKIVDILNGPVMSQRLKKSKSAYRNRIGIGENSVDPGQ